MHDGFRFALKMSGTRKKNLLGPEKTRRQSTVSQSESEIANRKILQVHGSYMRKDFGWKDKDNYLLFNDRPYYKVTTQYFSQRIFWLDVLSGEVPHDQLY
jgi:hypothetical protein